MKSTLFLPFLLSTVAIHAAPLFSGVQVDAELRNPTFSKESAITHEGGIITAPSLRIQARHVTYVNQTHVTAEEDLMISYNGQLFTGDKLEYDFVKGRGTIINGKTYTGLWFISGKEITINDDGSYKVKGAAITSNESVNPFWGLNISQISVSKSDILTAKNLWVNIGKLPVFWFPGFKGNLKFFTDSPIRYNITWDQKLGPRPSARYRIWASENANLYARVDYRIRHGFGAAIESNYNSPTSDAYLTTKSYGANDKEWPDERGNKRYRLQGIYEARSDSKKNHFVASYDVLSDDKMIGDFKSDDFEINTRKKTIVQADSYRSNFYSLIRVQPRVNRFQTINEELPMLDFGVRPFNIARTGLIGSTHGSAAYNRYSYAHEIKHLIPQAKAGRLEARGDVHRPTAIGPLTFDPYGSVKAIYYSASQQGHSTSQGIANYGATLKTELGKPLSSGRHTVSPRVAFRGSTAPLSSIDSHYVFSLADGLAQENYFEIGLQNALFKKNQHPFLPLLSSDIYFLTYLNPETFSKTIPRLFANIEFNRPTYQLFTECAWNFSEHKPHNFNTRGRWTLSSALALTCEYRYRSEYAWRVSDPTNYVIDFVRDLEDLLNSPLSDRRHTFLSRLQLQITPRLSCGAESRHGWGRKHEPGYNIAKFDFIQLLSSHWQLKVSYTHRENDNRVSLSLRLTK